jgi:hypothetical protein
MDADGSIRVGAASEKASPERFRYLHLPGTVESLGMGRVESWGLAEIASEPFDARIYLEQ